MGLFDSFKRKSDLYDENEEQERDRGGVDTRVPQTLSPVKQSAAREPMLGALQMQVLRPTAFEEAPKVADSLKSGQAVVLNLEDMEEYEARRMIDYVAGVLYAVDGKIERPAQRTFLLTPRGVSVASAEVERLHPEV